MAELAYMPHARQEAFHRDPRPWRWFCAGYGTGKTSATVIEALTLATVTHPGCTGIVAAPTYPLLFQSWVEVWRQMVPRPWWELKRDPLLGPHLCVRGPGGVSKIFLRSTDNPWSNEGINAAWLIFDEATREKDRAAFDVLLSRVRQGVPGRQLSVIVSGPPMSRRHWTSAEWGTGPGDGREGDMSAWHGPRHAVVRARTRDNPHLPAGYEASLRARPGVSSAWARQWLDAEFGAIEGQVYEAFSRDLHVVPAAQLHGRQWRSVGIGVDWGWEHPGAMLVVSRDGMGDLYVLHEEVHRHRVVDSTPAGWGPIACRLVRDWKPAWFVCDPSAPANLSALARCLREKNLARPVVGARNDVHEGIRRVTAALERTSSNRTRRTGAALYVSDACPHTIGEFESYSRRKARDGSVLEEPEETGDDAMDALRYVTVEHTG